MENMRITYRELSRWWITGGNVRDLNHLLPQLSKSAAPATKQWLRKMLRNGTRVFLAFHGKRIVGVTLLVPTYILVGRKDWIEDVVVDERYRGHKIGSRLIDNAEEASWLGKPKHINLTSTPDRGGARTMYESRGYVLRTTGVFRKKP
jgi:GNAT superfamily N-acetyltransferase